MDKAKAREMCALLADFLRLSLGVGDRRFIPLREELGLIRRYLAIEQVRFGERLRFEERMAEEALAVDVPPLLLQPLVENAVRHGIEASMRGGHVTVKAVARHGTARVLVSNSLPDVPTTPGAGIALANVRERLSLLHDIGASLETWRGDGQFHARITIPL
jgi:two-component system sensor histidine kinase AlgZ